MAPGVPKRAWTDDARHRGRRAINAIAEAPVSPAERVLHGQLQARYVIGYQADFRARTEILAYSQLRREIAAASPSQRAAMRADVENIVSSAGISGTSTGQLASEATSQQLAYALELGQDQGRYLARLGRAPADDGEPSPQASTESVAAAAAEVQAEDADSDEDTGHAEEVGSAAAEAFGSLLSFPSGNAAIQILQEYVSGVLEDGPAADALADFAGRVGGDDTADPAPSRRSTLTKRGRDLFGRQRITDFRRRRLKYRGGRRLGTGGGDDGGGVGASGGGD